MPRAAAAWVVEVNEGVIEATRQGDRWWLTFRHHQAARIVETKPACVVGGIVEVACEDQAHAEWLADRMVIEGMPKTAVRVKTAAKERTR